MKELEDAVRTYLQERKWDELRPGDIAKSISIEASELLELFQWTNPSLEEVRKDAKKSEEIKKELADVLIYCLDMSVLLGFDTSEVIEQKLEQIKQKYPAHLFQNREHGVDAGSEDAYWDIKKKHRASGN
jgi:NTP pyrophosphatase (non-canonical NTP hydrolase)